MNTFGKRLRSLREETGYNIREFAEKFNVGKTTISNWETDNRFPSQEMLIKLADYFDVSLDYLLCRADSKEIIIVKDVINGKDVELGVDKAYYPDGLTHEQVLEILEKLKKAGIKIEV